MKTLPNDLLVRELVERHRAIAPLEVKRGALNQVKQAALDHIASEWLLPLELQNEPWAVRFANGDGLHSWRTKFAHINEDGSHHFETELETYIEIAERDFLAGYLFNHAWDVFSLDQTDRFIASGIPLNIATEATTTWAEAWSARKVWENGNLPVLQELSEKYWLSQVSSLYVPIGRDAIYGELDVSRIASAWTKDGVPIADFPYSKEQLAHFADQWALAEGHAIAMFAIPMRFDHSTALIFPITKPAGGNYWAGRNNLTFTGDVHIHLEGQANHADLPGVLKRIDQWVKRFAGQSLRTGRPELSREDIESDVQLILTAIREWMKDKKAPTQSQIADQTPFSNDVIARRLRPLGGWYAVIAMIEAEKRR